jgi:hypothetical protein
LAEHDAIRTIEESSTDDESGTAETTVRRRHLAMTGSDSGASDTHPFRLPRG